MKWRVSAAKNGEATLSLNGIQLYSRYRPREDAWKWVEAEFDAAKESYLLIGLGLGYHAERLIELADGKPVYIYYFDEEEYKLAPLSQARNEIASLNLMNSQILIPNAWMNALSEHPLLPYLEDIKIKQRSFKKFSGMMEANFRANQQYFRKVVYPARRKNIAYLVASGPSLNETIHWLIEAQDNADIYVVGSALKMVRRNQIEPFATIISDAQTNIVQQLVGSDYIGALYFLSTANEQAVNSHQGEKLPLFQQGYVEAEKVANELQLPLLETGGSVSTTAISLLEYLGYSKIVLFGQDMGFSGKHTHATFSTSGREVREDLNLRKAIANNGEEIYTTPNLQVYARWIEAKIKNMMVQLYTTSSEGLAIKGLKLLSRQQFKDLTE